MKMSAIEKEAPKTIETIWNTYHYERNHTVSKVLSPSLYMQLMQAAQGNTFFVLPVPKKAEPGVQSGGHFMLLCQN